ncbi:hypothetical protein MNEG_9344 [Monoraphidium neglectum]|jgi:hypothetical protein|uniref:Uncharacterized protein n=1 Tax=Monoraphidium neglectum TaxID=145388 RepID=A0A0D2JGU9_9CHLO|nr:hypothetical protein MNEG_9344 [Monoraphidium neglectum]KIY98617.1 hypothetical protein MNEG_9344 [Monoraphidium neglectum]|eukprot:XP_013897637.1 hypothetical protein MNEG_9344 [Monoraphidium neglectum]
MDNDDASNQGKSDTNLGNGSSSISSRNNSSSSTAGSSGSSSGSGSGSGSGVKNSTLGAVVDDVKELGQRIDDDLHHSKGQTVAAAVLGSVLLVAIAGTGARDSGAPGTACWCRHFRMQCL